MIFTWLSFLVLQLLKRRLRDPCFPRNFNVLIYNENGKIAQAELSVMQETTRLYLVLCPSVLLLV
jgi:hypothetical protein